MSQNQKRVAPHLELRLQTFQTQSRVQSRHLFMKIEKDFSKKASKLNFSKTTEVAQNFGLEIQEKVSSVQVHSKVLSHNAKGFQNPFVKKSRSIENSKNI